MTIFLKRLFLFLLPFITIYLVNYSLKKNDITKNGEYEKKMATIIAQNQNLKSIANYNDRLYVKHLVEIKKVPNVILLGSSMMMEISSEDWNEEILNLSLTTCMLTDMLGIIDLLEKNKKLPKKIVLGFLPTSFNKSVEQGNNYKSTSLMKNYKSFCKRLGVNTIVSSNHLNFFNHLNPVVLKDRINQLSNQSIELPSPTKTEANIYFDGSKDFSAVYDLKKTEEVIAVSNLSSNDLQWTKAATMDPKLVEMFEKAVEWLQAKDVSVSIFLLPINPIVWKNTVAKGLKEKYETPENYLKSFAQKQGIFVFGTFNPAGYTIADYFDDKHLKLPVIKGIIDKQMPLYKSHVTNQQSIDYQKN